MRKPLPIRSNHRRACSPAFPVVLYPRLPPLPISLPPPALFPANHTHLHPCKYFIHEPRQNRFSSHPTRRKDTPPTEKAGAQADHSPLETRPLVVNLGTLRAGATGRRRFNVTNLNPVEVNVVSSGGGGSLPFASLRLVGVGPLSRAPQALVEIGKHIQVTGDCVFVRVCAFACVCGGLVGLLVGWLVAGWLVAGMMIGW